MPRKEERLGAHAGATEAVKKHSSSNAGSILRPRQGAFPILRWLERIAHDPALGAQAARVAICIATRCGKDGVARFKVAELAAALGTAYCTAYDAMHALLGRGYLQGEGVRNRGCAFRPAIPDAQHAGGEA